MTQKLTPPQGKQDEDEGGGKDGPGLGHGHVRGSFMGGHLLAGLAAQTEVSPQT